MILDTHLLLWWLDDLDRNSNAAHNAIREGKNQVYISAEVALKSAVGKREVPEKLEEVIDDNRFLSLPMTTSHARAVRLMIDHHRHPFDRILIAQATHESSSLVTRDPEVARSLCLVGPGAIRKPGLAEKTS